MGVGAGCGQPHGEIGYQWWHGSVQPDARLCTACVLALCMITCNLHSRDMLDQPRDANSMPSAPFSGDGSGLDNNKRPGKFTDERQTCAKGQTNVEDRISFFQGRG